MKINARARAHAIAIIVVHVVSSIVNHGGMLIDKRQTQHVNAAVATLSVTSARARARCRRVSGARVRLSRLDCGLPLFFPHFPFV